MCRRMHLAEIYMLIVLIMVNLTVVQLKHRYNCKVTLRPAMVVVMMEILVIVITKTKL